jgi:hypothetical protein
MKRQRAKTAQNREYGQGLVELALFMPIFIIILAGLAEVGQLVVAQNRVTNATRVGARFSANGGEDEGVVNIALNSITQTLAQSEDRWDIWSIRAKVDGNGTGFDEWSFAHVYGISNTQKADDVTEDGVRSQVLAELQSGGHAATAGIRIVAAYMIHDVEPILGLDALPLVANINSVQELTVMRVVGLNKEPTKACDAFPIAVHLGVRSVTPPGQGANPYPDVDDFGPGSPTPSYSSFGFKAADQNVPLLSARRGHVYKIQNGFGDGNFGWLRWNQGRPDDANTLNDSLTWPGDSADYTSVVNGGSGISGLPSNNHFDPDADGRINGYVEADDPTDYSMHIGDWVSANTGNVNSSSNRATLNGHVNKNRMLRVIVWDQADQQGNSGKYRIQGFAVFRLIGYNLTHSESFILAEFVRWDNSCGQVDS